MSENATVTFNGTEKKVSDLRVVDLRAELESRGLSKTGAKKELIARLENHIQESEKKKEEMENEKEKEEEITTNEEEPSINNGNEFAAAATAAGGEEGEDEDEKKKKGEEQVEEDINENQTLEENLKEEKHCADDEPKDEKVKKRPLPLEHEDIVIAQPRINETKRIKIDNKNQSDILSIRNLVRPFTLNQLKELLQRTGTIDGFWIDRIKSHCMVKFSKVEEAAETKQALDGVRWPNSNPKTLIITFGTKKEFEDAKATEREEPTFSSKPNGMKKEEKQGVEEERKNFKLLDDLFRKTKATPCIYWTVKSQ